MNRRTFITAGTGFALLSSPIQAVLGQTTTKTGRLKQSVARWCFGAIPIESFCRQLRDMGVTGMDLASPDEWGVCKRYGITPTMAFGGGSFLQAEEGSGRQFGRAFGWNKPENHAELIRSVRESIELAGKSGVGAIIGLFGDSEGMSVEEGIDNCVTGLRQIVPELEKNNITLAIELLNSLVDHPDYQGDNTAFGVEVCRRVGSEMIRLVYDAYHMQIMEGNLINTIRENINYIFHIQIAGVPGRNEIDETQEVNWRAVATAIAEINFQYSLAGMLAEAITIN